MTVDQFDDITPRQFDNKLKGFNDHYDDEQLQAWQRMRLTAFYSVAIHAKKGSIKKPDDLFKLPGEVDAKPVSTKPPMSNAQALELAKKWS